MIYSILFSFYNISLETEKHLRFRNMDTSAAGSHIMTTEDGNILFATVQRTFRFIYFILSSRKMFYCVFFYIFFIYYFSRASYRARSLTTFKLYRAVKWYP